MAFSYINRKGKTYYLHTRKTKTGKVRYVFARSIGDEAIDAIPEGYGVSESIHGQVSLGKTQPRLISEAEEDAVRACLDELDLGVYRVEVKHNAVIVHEAQRSVELPHWLPLSPFGSRAPMEDWARAGNYSPVLRFVLDDEERRVFHVARMTYRGDGGWSWPLGSGRLQALARKYLPHLGRESFFELM
jgi:hypothetical protein